MAAVATLHTKTANFKVRLERKWHRCKRKSLRFTFSVFCDFFYFPPPFAIKTSAKYDILHTSCIVRLIHCFFSHIKIGLLHTARIKQLAPENWQHLHFVSKTHLGASAPSCL